METPQAERSIAFLTPGDVLSTNATEMQAQLWKLMDQATEPWGVIELNLTRAQMIDSVGLNLLVALVKEAGARGKRVRVRIRGGSLGRIFRFTRLDQHLEIVDEQRGP